MPSKVVTKYLAQHAEPEAREIASILPKHAWKVILTVPLYGEDDLLAQFLEHLQKAAHVPVLTIFVVNERESSAAEIHASNQRSLDLLRQWFDTDRWEQGAFAFGCRGNLNALVQDRSSTNPFPADQGVGLARKIVGDIAVALWHHGFCDNPWISCSDADVLLHPEYFQNQILLQSQRDLAAVVHAYAHIPAPGNENAPTWIALQQYELWLRYYMRGLVAAGSPYHYTAIGSMISFHAERYAEARGFPKRLAGEDFYLLNKLRKLGDVCDLTDPVQRIMDRPSDRVPFGTGVGTQKILDQSERGEDYSIYDPRVFKVLSLCLDSVRQLRDGIKADIVEEQLKSSLDQHFAPSIAEGCFSLFWEDHGIPEQWMAAQKRSRNAQGAWREFHGWFDAFRTLRFIHTLRDCYLPNRPWREALLDASFLHDAGLNPQDNLSTWVEKIRRAPFGIFT